MMRVLYDLDGQEKACIQAMRHTRPSSISLYHSSRVPIGLRIVPTLTGFVSQAGFLLLLLCAPRFPVDLLQLGQLSAENCETDFSISASVLIGNK